MKVLHLLNAGYIGGTEVLCKDIALNSNWDNCFCFLNDGGPISDEIENSNIWVERLYQNEKSFFKIHRKLEKLMSSHKFDVVFVQHFGLSMDLHYNLLKRKFKFIGVKVLHVMYEPENMFKGRLSFIKKFMLNITLKNSEKIIGVSKAGCESFSKVFKIPSTKIYTVYNGISKNLINNGQTNIPAYNNELNILYVGRLVKVKGLDNAIKAINMLRDKLKVKLTIVGDGPERPKLEKLAVDLGTTNVRFVGFDRNVEKYYSNSNVFIYPSTWQEVFGISIVEAMAYGIPCIVNKKGGIPEIVTHQINGVITETDNDIGLYHALLQIYELYENNNLDILSKNCKLTAKKFSIENTISSLEKIFFRND